MIGVVIDYFLFAIYYFSSVIRSWAELHRNFWDLDIVLN